MDFNRFKEIIIKNRVYIDSVKETLKVFHDRFSGMEIFRR